MRCVKGPCLRGQVERAPGSSRVTDATWLVRDNLRSVTAPTGAADPLALLGPPPKPQLPPQKNKPSYVTMMANYQAENSSSQALSDIHSNAGGAPTCARDINLAAQSGVCVYIRQQEGGSRQ